MPHLADGLNVVVGIVDPQLAIAHQRKDPAGYLQDEKAET
jgi:hypothetical protein